MLNHAPKSKKPSFSTLLLSAAGLAVVPGAALAQDIPASDEIIVLGERAVSATKTDTPLIETPQAISVVTPDEIRDRTAIEFQDIYRYSAGVAANNSSDSRGDFVYARGYDAAQYLDGLKRMPDFIYGARLEPFTVAQAEVLRGPSSVLYGAGGPGGVLNVASKVPQFEFGGEVGFSFGSDSRLQGQADITGALTDGIAARMIAVVREGEDQWGMPNDRLLFSPSLRFQPGPDTDIVLTGLYQNDHQGSLGYVQIENSRLGLDQSRRVPFDFYSGEPDWSKLNTEFASVSLTLSHNFSDAITFSSASRYSDNRTDYQEIFPNYTANPYADAARTMLKREFYVNYEDSRVFNSDNHLSFEFSTGPIEHLVLAGVDYTRFSQDKDEGFSYDNYVDAANGFPFGSPVPINIFNPVYGTPVVAGAFNFLDYESSQIGFYLQNQMSYADRVHVVLGMRRDSADSSRNGVGEEARVAWSFRGGIIAEVAYGISPYFNYAESFLPVPGGDFNGNPYQPQVARQYEGGVKWEPMRGAQISFAYFDIVESNYLSQDPSNIQNFIQGGSIASDGFEVEAFVRMPENFEVSAAYSYTDAYVKTGTSSLAAGSRVAAQPRHLASLWGSRTFDFGADWSLRAGAGVRYIGNKIDSSQSFLTPEVTLVDAMLSVSNGPWSASLNASNLFNTRYYDTCSVFGPTSGFCTPAKDRTVIASISRRF